MSKRLSWMTAPLFMTQLHLILGVMCFIAITLSIQVAITVLMQMSAEFPTSLLPIFLALIEFVMALTIIRGFLSLWLIVSLRIMLLRLAYLIPAQ